MFEINSAMDLPNKLANMATSKTILITRTQLELIVNMVDQCSGRFMHHLTARTLVACSEPKKSAGMVRKMQFI